VFPVIAKRPVPACVALGVSLMFHLLAFLVYVLHWNAGPSLTPIDVQVFFLGGPKNETWEWNDDERALQSNLRTIEQEYAWAAITALAFTGGTCPIRSIRACNHLLMSQDENSKAK
jgi:hypothetical protein